MFFLSQVLHKKHPLGRVWIAAHMNGQIQKTLVDDTDIQNTVEEILNPQMKLALRSQAYLLYGLAVILSKQQQYLYNDCQRVLTQLQQSLKQPADKKEQQRANRQAINLDKKTEEKRRARAPIDLGEDQIDMDQDMLIEPQKEQGVGIFDQLDFQLDDKQDHEVLSGLPNLGLQEERFGGEPEDIEVMRGEGSFQLPEFGDMGAEVPETVQKHFQEQVQQGQIERASVEMQQEEQMLPTPADDVAEYLPRLSDIDLLQDFPSQDLEERVEEAQDVQVQQHEEQQAKRQRRQKRTRQDLELIGVQRAKKINVINDEDNQFLDKKEMQALIMNPQPLLRQSYRKPDYISSELFSSQYNKDNEDQPSRSFLSRIHENIFGNAYLYQTKGLLNRDVQEQVQIQRRGDQALQEEEQYEVERARDVAMPAQPYDTPPQMDYGDLDLPQLDEPKDQQVGEVLPTPESLQQQMELEPLSEGQQHGHSVPSLELYSSQAASSQPSERSDFLTKRTQMVLNTYRNKFESQEPAHVMQSVLTQGRQQEYINLNKLMKGQNRLTSSIWFYETLMGQNGSFIQANQEFNGDILIGQTDKLMQHSFSQITA